MVFLFRFRKTHKKYTAYQGSDSVTVVDVTSVNNIGVLTHRQDLIAQDY